MNGQPLLGKWIVPQQHFFAYSRPRTSGVRIPHCCLHLVRTTGMSNCRAFSRMASPEVPEAMPVFAGSRAFRRKAAEACERCREKRIKVLELPLRMVYAPGAHIFLLTPPSVMVPSPAPSVSGRKWNVSLPLDLHLPVLAMRLF